MNRNNIEISKKNFKASAVTKTLSIFVVLLMLGTSVMIFAKAADGGAVLSESVSFSFSEPIVEVDDTTGYATISVDDLTTFGDARTPALPSQSWVVQLPVGSKVIDVDFECDEEKTLSFKGIVEPVPTPLPLLMPNDPLWKKITIPSDPTLDDVYTDKPYGTRFSSEVAIGQMNGELKTIVSGRILPVVLSSVVDDDGSCQAKYIKSATVTVTYTLGSSSTGNDMSFDLLILTPSGYVSDLLPLVEHKEDMGLKVKMVKLDDIYNGAYFPLPDKVPGTDKPFRDNQERIKYFIYKAVLEWDVKYVLAVGGYRTFWGLNIPNKLFPVRYAHYDDGAEPGYVSDQYYSCCIKYDSETGATLFETCDSNNNDLFMDNSDSYDHDIDVAFGRLPCRNRIEVRTMVNKIITYETPGPEGAYNSDWFKSILTITGDGFQDLNSVEATGEAQNGVLWPISSLPDGEYTIYAQSVTKMNLNKYYPYYPYFGPIDSVNVTIDRSAKSKVSFGEDDHLKVEPINPDQERVYPGKPVCEIVVPQDGDILGNTNVNYNPTEAYCSDFFDWGKVSYTAGSSLFIRVKAYEAVPHYNWWSDGMGGSQVRFNIWVNNSKGETVFSAKPYGNPAQWLYQRIYYEGEVECGYTIRYTTHAPAQPKHPEIFRNHTALWTSNGNWSGMWDVIDAFSKGYGFVYFAGHGNPMSWGDHLPGIPGGRRNGMIMGLKSIDLEGGTGWERYYGQAGEPFFPMDHLTNGYKQPVTIIGGCHNSMFDASFTRLLADPNSVLFTVLHGAWAPESFGEWLIRVPQGGSIATIGNTGLGYGAFNYPNIVNMVGGFVDTRFFLIYSGSKVGVDYEIYRSDMLGEVHKNVLFCLWYGGTADEKTFAEWVLLGDPSLRIGGYPPQTAAAEIDSGIVIGDIELVNNGKAVQSSITNTHAYDLKNFDWVIRFDPISPLGRYFGLSNYPFLMNLLKGRVLNGGVTTGHVATLEPGEELIITSGSVFGFGHIEINISLWDRHDTVDPYDDELIQYKLVYDSNMDGVLDAEEDGFLLGNRIILKHPEE